MDDRAKLMEMLQMDMKHWSVNVLKEALHFVDDKCLSEYDNGLFWWELRRLIYAELISREAGDENQH